MDEIHVAKAHVRFLGIDFDVGEPIEAWLDVGEWFIPTSWSKGEGEACLNVGEPLPFFLERQAQ